ncbi:MAG: ABC transporter permease [Clostridia bacterium]|nr:ABC transporter permease [Clostridia bacterium]MDD4570940.1 ABC transporter permease [Clostridia bacterium]
MLKKIFKSKLLPQFYLILFLVIFFGIWQFFVNIGSINPFLFSSPIDIFKDMFNLFATGEIWPHIFVTLYASFWGVVIGTVSGIIVAFIFGNIKILADIFDPLFVGLYGLPKLALGPLFIVWFGISITAKIFMSTIMVFFLVFFNAYAGFRNVDVNLINMMKLMGANRLQIITKLTLPSCIPWITASLRAGVGAAVLGTIVGEYLGAVQGLGWMVMTAGGVYNITRVLSCIFILMILMSLLDFSVKKAEAIILKWRPAVD